jgi:hypothetical protein
VNEDPKLPYEIAREERRLMQMKQALKRHDIENTPLQIYPQAPHISGGFGF